MKHAFCRQCFHASHKGHRCGWKPDHGTHFYGDGGCPCDGKRRTRTKSSTFGEAAANGILAAQGDVMETARRMLLQKAAEFVETILSSVKLIAGTQRLESIVARGPAPDDVRKTMAEPRAPRTPRASRPKDGDSANEKGPRSILSLLAQRHHTNPLNGATTKQLTVLLGYTKSTRNTYLRRLTADGYVERSADRIVITQQGLAAIGDDYEQLPSGKELYLHWRQKLPEGEGAIMEALSVRTMHRDQVATTLDYTKSTTNTYVRRLLARELVQESGGTLSLVKELADAAAGY